MDTERAATDDPALVMADLQAVLASLMTQRPLDPEVERRVEERSERMTEDLRRRYGELNVAVDLIREIRDEG
jgi:hypothetical protein